MPEYPGDTTAEDWDDSRYLFFAMMDHGEQTTIARIEPKRRKNGTLMPGERDQRRSFCEEHYSFEVSMVPIAGEAALAWANGLRPEKTRSEAPK